MKFPKPLHVLPAIFLILSFASIASAQQSQNASPTPPAGVDEKSIVDNFVSSLVSAKTEEKRQAVLASRRELMTAEIAKALMVRGELLRVQGEYAAAINLHQTVLDINTSLKDEAGMARALDYLGRVRHAQNDFKGALELYERSLALWTKSNIESAGLADTFNDFARTFYARREYDKAQTYFEKAMQAARASGNKSAIAVALNGFGIVRFYDSDITAALEFYEQSRNLCEEIDDQENLSNALNNIALVYTTRGDYRRAIGLYEKTIKLYEALGARKRAARSLVNLANAYSSLNDHPNTIKSLQRSLAISEALDDKLIMAMALNNTGVVYYTQGDFDLSLHYFQKSLAMRQEVGVRAQMIPVMNSIADVYRKQGRYDQALKMYSESLAISEAAKEKRHISPTLEGIGDIHLVQKNYAAAQEAYERAFKAAEQSDYKRFMVRALARLGGMFAARGDYLKALENADRAAAMARPLGLVETLWQARIVAGEAHRALHQFAEARTAFTEAISVIENLRGQVIGGEREQQSFLADKLAPYTALIELSLEEGDTLTAFAFAEQAKARVLLDVLQGGRVEINKALTMPERTRERALNGELSALNERLGRERENEKPDAARLNDLLARQQKTRLDYEAFQASLYAAHPELAVQRGASHPLQLDELNALVPDAKTVLLEYVVGENRTLLFVITKSKESNQIPRAPTGKATLAAAPQTNAPTKSLPDLHVFSINITREELTKRVAHFQKQIATRDLLFSNEARALYETLLAPAAAELQNRTRLILIPDAALWELPFQTLQSTNNEYLIEHHALSYAPSLSVLGEIAKGRAQRSQRRSSSNSALLAFGNPSFKASAHQMPGSNEIEASHDAQKLSTASGTLKPQSALADLPEAERQVRLLGALYGGARSRVYTGAEAREDRLKNEAQNFRILHLATHSVLDDASPMYSHVLLTPSAGVPAHTNNGGPATLDGNGEDGLLEAWEIMQLNLQADMVVLSACETARGRVASGEGMIGLSWALFVAGSPTTVVSQWKVESASTTDLMLAFYGNLRAGSNPLNAQQRFALRSMSKAEALRQASLTLLHTEKYRHPFYWAGFIIIGDGN
jgi:CHAT domain-containing protein/tetratricopeptide (TPR) repeat protein